MRHRSALRHALGLAVAVVASCALPALATAVPATIPVPVDAPTVATSPSGAAVIAWVLADRRLCTAVQLAGAVRPAQIPDTEGGTAPGGPASDCWPAPLAAAFDADRMGTTALTRDRHMTWGWTGTGAASVELRRRGTVFGTGPATPSPTALPGEAADLRFFAIEHAAGPALGERIRDLATTMVPDQLLLRDASGTVRRADDLIEPPTTEGPVLQRGRWARGGWFLSQEVTRPLAPTPLAPERRETRRCLKFTLVSDSGLDGSGSLLCDGDPDGQPYLMDVGADCSLGGRLEVLVRAPTRRVVAVLGDGRRRAVPLATLSPGTRAGTLIVGAETAVRRTIALSATGRVLATQSLGLPPQTRGRCLRSYGFLGSLIPPASPALPGDTHSVHVTDHGERICVAADRAPRIPQECALPPFDPHTTRLTVRPTRTGRVLTGVTSSEIAAVRATLSDGSSRTFPTAPVAGYAGRYATVLRQVVADLPGTATVVGAAALDARGRTLTEHAAAEDAPLQHGRTLLRVPDAPPLRARTDTSSLGEPATCLWLGAPSRLCPVAILPRRRGAGLDLAHVEALCAPHRLLVLAVLPRRADRLVVRVASGHTVTARRVRIPAGSGPASGLYAHLAVLGPRERMTAIAQRGPAARSLRVPLPPATRQCGYAVELGLR